MTTTAPPIFSAGPVSETVKLDSVAPTTTSLVAPASPDLANGWYGSGPTVTLSPSDATSGVASTKYTIDGGAVQTYSAPFAVATEGAHTIAYWSNDNAGNQESAQQLTVKVDLNPPSSLAQITPAAQNGWYASPTVTLTGNDGAGFGDRPHHVRRRRWGLPDLPRQALPASRPATTSFSSAPSTSRAGWSRR